MTEGLPRTRFYRQAALAYLLYASIYLIGAWMRMTPGRQISVHGVSWWWFFVGGGILLVVLPVLIWREHKWLTRIITFGPAYKALKLSFHEFRSVREGQEIDPYYVLFIGVALIAAFLMARASWFSGSTE